MIYDTITIFYLEGFMILATLLMLSSENIESNSYTIHGSFVYFHS